MDAVKIGNTLRELRTARNERPEDVAIACNVSASTINMYETGKRIPRDDIKQRLANYFGRSVGDIFYCA